MNSRLNCIILLITILSVSCGTPEKKIITPGAELSKRYNGRAVITEITDSKNENESDNKGYVDIYFRFVPSDPDSAKSYLCSKCSDSKVKLFYDNRESFHKNWVSRWDIKPGSGYPAIRHELRRKDNSTGISYEVFLEPER